MQYCHWTYFFLFLPIVILLYIILPKKGRFIIILIADYVFFYLISGKLLVYLIMSTFSIHHFGLWLDNIKKEEKEAVNGLEKEEKKIIRSKFDKKKRWVLVFGIVLQALMLVFTKYLTFIFLNVNNMFSLLNINIKITGIQFFAPIGISFYTLMAISYLVDVYRGKIEADNNILRLATFLSFFPQIMEGPIARYDETAMQIYCGEKIHYKNLCFGMQRMLFGLVKKMVVADRLNSAVELIFNNYSSYNGGFILLGVVLYVIQLYMDFTGVMDVVIGTGEIFNVKLPENFRQPFFSKNISDFWSRWHITLGTWFKDYIFYPISLAKWSKKVTINLRQKLGNHFGPLVVGTIALAAVWFCNGLWHGAGYNYLFFGLYHFTFILIENLIAPLIDKFYERTNIKRTNILLRIVLAIKTSIIVLFGELFFKAPTLKIGFIMFKKIFTAFSFSSIFSKKIYTLGLDGHDLIIVGLTILIVLIISILKEKGINIRESIAKKPIYIRWTIYYLLIFYVLIFGAFGGPYAPIDPMYASF